MSNSVAIVTGGSSGIGQAICVALAREGYQIVVVGLNAQRIEETLALLHAPEKHIGLSLDVTEPEDMDQMAKETVTAFGQIDLLVASAGVGRSANSERFMPYPTAALPLTEWNTILNVNLKGVFLSNRAVLPQMMRQKSGQIINICSSTTPKGLRGEPYAPAYCASKFGVVGLTESLAQEVASQGIRVQALFPGMVRTPMVAQTAIARRYGGNISAEEFASSVLYLVNESPDTVSIHPHVLPLASLHYDNHRKR
ncbi:MAG: SDR family NAD(P)-dependent oxidoreductase [Cyanobacteria bacterium]|jgi:NAD(P)-dependent dehydrogenase (short-subunit alcohol dehydrogenase family)|nr:SDR family NAD(P)-dependent oxidoreductase [Cyanobacteria bacterium GSL.Bin21]